MAVTQHPSGAQRALSVHYPRVLSAEFLAATQVPGTFSYRFSARGVAATSRSSGQLGGPASRPAGRARRMTPELDGGPIVDQSEVVVGPDGTGGSLHSHSQG